MSRPQNAYKESTRNSIETKKTDILLAPKIPEHALRDDRERNVNRGKSTLVHHLECHPFGLLVPLDPIHLFAMCVPKLDQAVHTRARVGGLAWPLVHGHQIEQVARTKSEHNHSRERIECVLGGVEP